MKLALGPHQNYWPRQAMMDFYGNVAESPVDIVYVGESVCSRRHEMRLEDWFDVARVLAEAGKEVVFSSLVLIESESDLKVLRKLVNQPDFRVEANDMAAVQALVRAGHKHWVAGPTLNVFNPETITCSPNRAPPAGRCRQRWPAKPWTACSPAARCAPRWK